MNEDELNAREYEAWLQSQPEMSDEEYDTTMSAIYDNYVTINT